MTMTMTMTIFGSLLYSLSFVIFFLLCFVAFSFVFGECFNSNQNMYAFYRFIKFSPTNDDEDENATYTLTFNIEFPHENDTVYFAHSYPYTYSDLQVSSEKKKKALKTPRCLLLAHHITNIDAAAIIIPQFNFRQLESFPFFAPFGIQFAAAFIGTHSLTNTHFALSFFLSLVRLISHPTFCVKHTRPGLFNDNTETSVKINIL